MFFHNQLDYNFQLWQIAPWQGYRYRSLFKQMYVCIYIYICVCICMCIYIYVCIYMYIYIYDVSIRYIMSHVYIYMYVILCICKCMSMYVYVSTWCHLLKTSCLTKRWVLGVGASKYIYIYCIYISQLFTNGLFANIAEHLGLWPRDILVYGPEIVGAQPFFQTDQFGEVYVIK